jgi:hypothetical protein
LRDHLAAEAIDAFERLRQRCPTKSYGNVAHAYGLEGDGIGRHVGRSTGEKASRAAVGNLVRRPFKPDPMLVSGYLSVKRSIIEY